jgi:hypothetical protein
MLMNWKQYGHFTVMLCQVYHITLWKSAHLWALGNSVVNFVGLMLLGLFAGLKFGVGIMLNT